MSNMSTITIAASMNDRLTVITEQIAELMNEAQSIANAVEALAIENAVIENDRSKDEAMATITEITKAVTARGDRRRQIEQMVTQGHSAKSIAEALGTHVGYVYTVKRNMVTTTTDNAVTTSRVSAKQAIANAKTGKTVTKRSRKSSTAIVERGDRKRQILSMLADGHSPADIASALGTHVAYVYTVRKAAQRAA